MPEVGNDSYFYFYSPYAQVNAVDFRVVSALEFLDIYTYLEGGLLSKFRSWYALIMAAYLNQMSDFQNEKS